MTNMYIDSDIKYDDEEITGPISWKVSFILTIWRTSNE